MAESFAENLLTIPAGRVLLVRTFSRLTAGKCLVAANPGFAAAGGDSTAARSAYLLRRDSSSPIPDRVRQIPLNLVGKRAGQRQHFSISASYAASSTPTGSRINAPKHILRGMRVPARW